MLRYIKHPQENDLCLSSEGTKYILDRDDFTILDPYKLSLFYQNKKNTLKTNKSNK